MSETFSIGCMPCKESLWIGQQGYIYRGEESSMIKLERFLYKHQGHHLEFHTDYNDDFDGFKEMVPVNARDEELTKFWLYIDKLESGEIPRTRDDQGSFEYWKENVAVR